MELEMKLQNAITTALLMLSILCSVKVLNGQVPFKKGQTTYSSYSIEAEYGLINWPPGVFGIEFDFSQVDRESLIGKKLDLNKVVKGIIISRKNVQVDTITYEFDRSILKKIELNREDLTDFI